VSLVSVGTVNGVAHSKESGCELESDTPIRTFVWVRNQNIVKILHLPITRRVFMTGKSFVNWSWRDVYVQVVTARN
jgi:hypothetical protein